MSEDGGLSQRQRKWPFCFLETSVDTFFFPILICFNFRNSGIGGRMKKQIIVIVDMEGASGIFDHNGDAIIHGSSLWREYGRKCITSDVLAVCQAAHECGIGEILIYDRHYAGEPEHNIIVDELPRNIKLFDTWNRCFDWRRIRGQAELEPFGLITVGQHARYGETDAYFPHTIQSPPIKALQVNGKNIAEIGMCAYSFFGTKYIANVGCMASMK